MAMDFQVGSLGNLISGKSEKCFGPKIVFEKVKLNPNQSSDDKQIVNGLKSPKLKALAKVQEKGRAVKGKIIGSLLKNKKPDLAGDNDSKTIGKSWMQFPNRGDDSEGDGFQPQTSSFSLNAARRIHIKNNTKKHVDGPEREKRTLYVGNIPYAQSKKKKLIKLFSKYGVVESVRFRCAPLKDPRMPKKVAVIKKDFHPERSSICAYVVFKSEAEAKCALEANGSVYHDHHLRVDLAANASDKLNDPRKSVFVGNLSFAAEEEELWQLFSECGTISSVRIIRDPITAVSKGVAFVNFETTDAAELALHLNGNILRKRSITVNRHRPSAQPSVEKNLSENRKDKSSEINKNKKNLKEEIRMKKKEKRKLRREGEKLILGFVSKKKSQSESSEVSKSEMKQQPAKTVTQNPNSKEHSKSKFQGQTFENSRKKKKKVNKTELKKKKLAKVLGAKEQKKKEGS